MKALIVSNLDRKFSHMHYSMIVPLQNLGYEVTYASNFSEYKGDISEAPCKTVHIDFVRNPYNPKNIKAYSQLLRLMKDQKYDLVHCNTPIGGVIGRLCAHRLALVPVVYTAHGFHFYGGAPLKNWLLSYPAEYIMARWTDGLITMNQEDLQAAQKLKLRNKGQVHFIHGVGIDADDFKTANIDRKTMRKNLGLGDEDVALVSMGDLITRKNYPSAIKAIAKANNPKVHYFICGIGPEEDKLKKLCEELKVNQQVHFLGFRTDVKEIVKAVDIFIFTTYQEGLPRSMMEAMSAGLPCIASKIRGNTDLIEDGQGGYLYPPDDVNGLAHAIQILANDRPLRENMGQCNLATIQEYDIENVKREMLQIYSRILADGQ